MLAKELQAGSYPQVVVRSDGEPALLAHVRAARAVTMVANVPLESVHEQVSKEQSPGNGLAEGAVKEPKAKIRTSRHSTEMGLVRQIREAHDSLAWLVTHAAATGQGSTGRRRTSFAWSASFADQWLHGDRMFGG